MKYLFGYMNPFMSPMSGKFASISQLPSLVSRDYIIIGDRNGNAIISPALIDVKLDIVELRTLLEQLKQLRFILQQGSSIAPNAQALDQLTSGFVYNNPDGVLSIEVPGGGTISLPYGQVFVGDVDNLAQPTQLLNKQLLIGNSSNRAETTTVLFLDNMANLSEKKLWIGNNLNRPIETTILFLENMANLAEKKIWRGNILGRPIESDDLTNVENSIGGILSDLADLASIVSAISSTVDALSSAVDALETGIGLIGGFAAILLLQAQVLGLLGAVSGLDSRLSTAENEIDVLQGQVGDIYSQLDDIHTQLISINSQLVTINEQIFDIQEDIEEINVQLAEIAADIADINTRIDNLSATFVGDVQGSGLLSSPINLELMLTLDQIKKAEDTVDINNNKIINLVSDDVEQLDALNAKFLWDLMHDNVGVVWV